MMKLQKLLQIAGLFTLLISTALITQSVTNPAHHETNNVVSMEPFIGEIAMFAGNFAPRGWALCDGQLLSINENTALFSILGTTYGGDGRTSFALPDLRGRVPIHAGQGPGLSNYRLGQLGGAESTMLTANQLPSHTLNLTGTAEGVKYDITKSTKNVQTDSGKGVINYVENVERSHSGTPIDINVQGTYNNGGQAGVNNRSPYGTVNYIIALQGIYPSRN